MSITLAIDQSTSATKALLIEPAAGRLIARESVEHRQIYPQPGWVEHDAEEIWQNTLAAVGRLGRPSVDRVSITNQRETVVVFDRKTGAPLHNAIVWQCRRGTSLCDEFNRAGHGRRVADATGLKIDPYFSASKLTWMIRNRPEIAARLRDGSAVAGTIDAYLVHRLTGGRVLATDHTNASRTLLLDIRTLRWDEHLCRLFDVPTHALPEVRDSTAQYGETDAGGRLARPAPIVGVMGDSQASLFAHRCFEPGMAKVTLGSGSSVLLNIGRECRPGGDAAVTTVAWTHRGTATYSYEGIVNATGATVQWLRDRLQLIEDAGATEAIAAGVPDNGGVYLVPAFAGLGAPHWSAGAKAAIVGLTAHATRAHVVRAALESIAYQVRDVLDAMGGIGGVSLSAVHADGGATRNQFLMQFIADMTGLRILAADLADCSPIGAALAGLLGSGECGGYQDLARLPYENTVYAPRMSRDQADDLHRGWRRAVKQVVAGVDG